MKQFTIIALFSLQVLVASTLAAQSKKIGSPAPVLPLPTAAQLQWHEMEMNAFVHFTINTFTGKEWGYGDESPALFNPSDCDPTQWTSVLKATGFKGLILTTKHHDGFCLWPSKYTEHSIQNSPYKGGKGDLVKETSNAARASGLKFGIYLSPWDRNRTDYGTPAYIAYYRNQLKELIHNYGPVFEMWFDGANGGDGYYGGAREMRRINGASYYDWPKTLDQVRNMQPNIIFFSDAGPGVRWAGNERGAAGETNWNTISIDTLYAGKAGIENLLNTGSPDGKNWVPAETDVSIRPGWFYHNTEDSLVKTPQQLFDIYLSSVGRGATLLLNIPPDKRGLFHETDVKSLHGFAALLKKELGTNLAAKAKASASNTRGGLKQFAAANLTDGNKNTYWATDDNTTKASVEISLKKKSLVKYILLQEYIRLGQRVKQFTVEAWKDGAWWEVASATTIGYKRILKIDPVETNKIRINIKDSKACPVLSAVEVY
ncbi:MAG TPA: alpha-L-fucosidase [Flavisolibacter sp.]|nr:alpha-L-fucosidase [Flavisolibacter sp.]